MSRCAVLVVSLLLLGGCPGSMPSSDQRVGDFRSEGRATDRKLGSDRRGTVDLPVTPGVPCLSGACGPNLICMANVCSKMCDDTRCNNATAGCGAAESCIWGSDFTGACVPATAKLGASCEDSFCVQGSLCVKVGSGTARCYGLCSLGCPAGTTCGTVSNGCKVCY